MSSSPATHDLPPYPFTSSPFVSHAVIAAAPVSALFRGRRNESPTASIDRLNERWQKNRR
jgi:hypothetical protein